jgi:beta-glucosidase
VERYYHWTFIDNFEWLDGESAAFGLVACDFETQKRTVRKSGEFYSEMIKTKQVSQQMIDGYLKK